MQVGDHGLLQLRTHTSLEELALAGLPVTNLGLSALRDMHRLGALDLTWCNRMGDAGTRREYTCSSTLILQAAHALHPWRHCTRSPSPTRG